MRLYPGVYEPKTEDLDRKILRNEKTKRGARNFFLSRFVITALVIIAQLALLLVFLIGLTSRLEYYLVSSVALSSIFMIYIANSHGKNEYKIAWIAPVVIVPLVGIACYFLYHIDAGAKKLKREIKDIDKNIEQCILNENDVQRVLSKYPDFENLGHYLYNNGRFRPNENTSIKYYPTGEEFLPAFIDALKQAKKFIFIEFFIIRIEESWDQILQVLIQKVKEGVEVRVICDGFGTYMVSAKEYQKYLHELGIKAKVFNVIHPIVSTPINNRDHRKIIVIDGECGFTGGINLANEYFNIGHNKFPYWKDNGIKLAGDAVYNMLQMFLEVWNIGEKTKDDYHKFLNDEHKFPKETGLVIPYGDHAFNDEDIAENVCLDIISSAKKYLYITTPYVVVDNQILSALIFVAKKGVDVRVIVPSVPDHLVTFCVGKTFLKNLLDGGVKVYVYKKGFIHAKTFLADGKTATVGSINLDYRSFYAHFECGVLMHNCDSIADIKKDFDSMFINDCEEMLVTDYKKLPLYQRFIGRILRIFGPLM